MGASINPILGWIWNQSIKRVPCFACSPMAKTGYSLFHYLEIYNLMNILALLFLTLHAMKDDDNDYNHGFHKSSSDHIPQIYDHFSDKTSILFHLLLSVHVFNVHCFKVRTLFCCVLN